MFCLYTFNVLWLFLTAVFSWQRFFHTTIIKYFLSTNFIFRVSKNVSYWPQIHAQRKIVQLSRPSSLTHFQPMFNFYTLWKHQKTRSFWCFQGVQKWNIGWKWVKYASWKHTDSRDLQTSRSSDLRCSVKKSVLKNFAICTGKQLYWGLFLTMLQVFRTATLLKRDFNTGMLLWIMRTS